MSSTNTNVAYTSVPTGRTADPKTFSIKSLLITLVTIVGSILVGSIILAIFFRIEWHKRNCPQIEQGISINENDTCSTEYCIEAAKYIRNKMDETVDPCENFYEFTCGSWMRNTNMPNDSLPESSFTELQKELNTAIANLLSSLPSSRTVEPKAMSNARRLYKTCIDELALEVDERNSIDLFINNDLGGWPSISGSSWNSSMFDLSNTLLKINQFNTFPFYHVTTTIVYSSSALSRYLISITPGYRNEDPENSFLNEFTISSKHSHRHLSLALGNYRSTTDTQKTSLSDFDEEINEHLLTSGNNFSSRPITTTVRDLTQTINTDFDFSDYIHRLYLLANVTLRDDDVVLIDYIQAIRKISSIINQHSPETLQRYIIRYFLRSQAFHMRRDIRTNIKDAKQNIVTVSDGEPRAIGCAKYVNKNMQYAVSKLHIKKYYDQLVRKESLEIVNRIRHTFINMVNASTWMDTVSKTNTIEKVRAIVIKIGYPEYLHSDNLTKLESIYTEYKFTSSHLQNVLLLLQINSRKRLQRLRVPIIPEEWAELGLITLDAFYRSFFNDITISAGILQTPFFHKDAPKYLNYGAIGSVVGHEITHGFDELRRHLDKDGKNYTVWSQKTTDRYDKRSKCIVEQYDNYTVSQINRQVNGENTRDENIADNDGLKKSFYAYQKWVQSQKTFEKKLPGFTKYYSPEQMFFISFGQLWCSKMTDKDAMIQNSDDEHSPGPFRSIGSTSNFVEFDRAFGCKPGQGNSRVNKCGVW